MPEVWTPPAFDDISTSETVTAAQLNAFGNSLRFLELVDLDTITSDVSVTATAAVSAVTVSSVSATTEAVLHVIRFSAARILNPLNTNVTTNINLWEDSTDLGIWGVFRSAATGDSSGLAIYLEYFFTPTAASHTYTVKAWRVTNNTTINGVAGTYLPIQTSLFRVPT